MPPIICAAAHALLSPTATGEMMYMPGGRQTITPFAGGIDQPITVQVDASGAAALNAQLCALKAKGKAPYFDFEHADNGASFWPTEFYWSASPEPGIYAKGEWTKPGKEGVEGKTWRQFSPVFHVDNKRANPARIVCHTGAKPNMGGLVNDPAFVNLSPLWAKNAGGAHPANNDTTNDMDPKALEALHAKNKELTNEIARLNGEQAAIKAKGENTEFITAKLELKESQLRETALTIANGELKAKNSTAEAEILAARQANAKAAVQTAVDRGAIAAKDTDTISQWEKDITADPTRSALLAKMLGNPAIEAKRLTSATPGLVVTNESPNNIIKAFGAVIAKNAAIPLSNATAADKAKLAREAAAIFAKDISANAIISGMSIDDAIQAADYSDAVGGVGLLSGSLVLQKSLAMMTYTYPVLDQITTDFSAEPGQLNQTANTRIIQTPAVQTYSTTLGTDGRPAGWSTASPAQTIDVPVTLDTYYGVPIVFGIGTVASTVRDLFGEQAPLALYALGGAFVNKLTVLMTSANFNAYAGTAVANVVTTSGSKNITFDSSTIVWPGAYISGTGIPANTFIASVTSAMAAVMTQKATASATVAGTINNSKVPNVYVTYAKALSDFNTACLADLKAAFSTNEVPFENRFTLLNSTYYGRLTQDPVFNMFAAIKSPDLITAGQLPRVQGFSPIEAPFFPTTNYGVGFAGHKSSLVMKTRLPQQLGQSFAAQAPGSITVVTDPNTGISMSLVQFWNLQTMAYEWRPEVLCGASAGDRRCGLLLTSQ